jgi:hypothetical protein
MEFNVSNPILSPSADYYLRTHGYIMESIDEMSLSFEGQSPRGFINTMNSAGVAYTELEFLVWLIAQDNARI